MCVQVRYVLWGLIAKDPVHEQTFVIFKLIFVGSLFSSPLISGQQLELYLEGLTLQLFCAENLISF